MYGHEVAVPHEPEMARERDRRHVWHTWSPLAADRSLLMLNRGEGCRVWDVDGKEYIDAASLNSTCGYGRSDVVDEMMEQARRFHGVDISLGSHELLGLLAERLAGYLGSTLSKTLLVNSGSEAVEAAVFITKGYWEQIGDPRTRVVTFARGYHGSTLVSRSLSGLPRVAHTFQAPFPVSHVELPVPPHQLRRTGSLPLLVSEFERAIEGDGSNKPMAVVVEPFINVGGAIVLPPGFLRELRRICDEAGTLLVLDEVFTGYGRAGRMFACQREEVEPDIIVSSKGLAGGYAPIAAVTVRQSIHDTFRTEQVIGGLRYGHTTSGHAVACAAALATLEVLDKEELPDRAEQLGASLLERLAWLGDHEDVIDVRRFGLILAIEFSSIDVATLVVRRAEELGLLVRQLDEVVMVVPPLSIANADLTALGDRLEGAVSGAAR